MLNTVGSILGLTQMAVGMARDVAGEVLNELEPVYPTAVRLVRGAARVAGAPARVGGRVAGVVVSSTAISVFRGVSAVLRRVDQIAKGPMIFLPLVAGPLLLYWWNSRQDNP